MMKKIGFSRLQLEQALLLLTTLMTFSSSPVLQASEAKPQADYDQARQTRPRVIGQVYSVSGKAFVSHDASLAKSSPAVKGQEIYDGDFLITDHDSQMRVTLGKPGSGKKDAALLIKSDSIMKVIGTPNKRWLVDVTQGSFLSFIKKRYSGSRFFHIKTPAAVLGVRGTIFFTKYFPGKALFLCTCNGIISVDDRMLIGSTSHGAPKKIRAPQSSDEPIYLRLQDAQKGHEHTDEDTASLVEALNS